MSDYVQHHLDHGDIVIKLVYSKVSQRSVAIYMFPQNRRFCCTVNINVNNKQIPGKDSA